MRQMTALLLLALLAGCSSGNRGESGEAAGGAASDCDALGKRLLELGRASMQGLEGRDHTVMESQLALVKDGYVKACKSGDQGWPASVRACMARAESLAAFDACAAELLHESDGAADGPANSTPPASR